MASDVKHGRNTEGVAPRVAGAIASLSDPTDYRAVVRAVLENAPVTSEERRERTNEALDRLRDLRAKQLARSGEPLPDGWAARVIREGRR